MASSRSRQRTLLALSACLLLATAIAWTLKRRPAPEADAPAPLAASAKAPDVAAAPPPGATAPAEATQDSSGIPHTRLPLRLLATVVRENRTLSLATVEDLERSANEVLNEGQSFEGHPNARIARIERARVLIDHDGVREQLVITHHAAPEEDLTPEERERRRGMAQRLRDLTDAGPEALAAPERGGLLAEGDVSPIYEDGEMVGVQFDEIRAGGVYDQIGLRNGDVVTDINGVSLGDPAAAALVLGQFAGSDELSIQVQRNGARETLKISTDAFEQAVEQLE